MSIMETLRKLMRPEKPLVSARTDEEKKAARDFTDARMLPWAIEVLNKNSHRGQSTWYDWDGMATNTGCREDILTAFEAAAIAVRYNSEFHVNI